MRPVLWMVLVAGCGQDIKVTQAAVCDGVKQKEEEYVDSPFDRDGDGFFDAGNPDCQETYELLDCNDALSDVHPGAPELPCDGFDNDCDDTTPDALDLDEDGYDECDDCDDNTPDRNPGLVEVPCNGIDDDCDDETPDFTDNDADGVTSCEDCNDNNDTVYPGAAEECDGVDNNCDGEIDDTCVDYTGNWSLDVPVTYQCADLWGTGTYIVNLNVTNLSVIDTNPTITMNGGGSQPGTMSGTISDSGYFSVSRTITGSCDETYAVEGTFTSETEFEGTFSASFSGSLCLDCANQVWAVSGTKN